MFWCKLQVHFTQVLSDDEDVSDQEQQAQVRHHCQHLYASHDLVRDFHQEHTALSDDAGVNLFPSFTCLIVEVSAYKSSMVFACKQTPMSSAE